MRFRLAAGTFALGSAGLLMLMMVTPAAAGRMSAQDIGADCEQAAMDSPDGRAGLKVTTQVPDGTTVAPGDDITIRLTWDPKDWSGADLDAALACVQVKGGLDPDLSRGERPTANDGVFEYVLHVPDNIRPGCDICVQGFLTGMAADGGPRQVRSERPCFMSGSRRPPTPPATTPATSPAAPATTPATSPAAPATTPATSPAAPATTPATSPAAPATTPATSPAATTTTSSPRIPTEVGGITASKPAPAPLTPAPLLATAPAAAPAAELPRTGSPLTELATAGGGMTLSLGGLAVMGGAGRRRRRKG